MPLRDVFIPGLNDERDLSERERAILRSIIHLYILNAAPIGSRNLSKYLERELTLSPATIRNVMSDLEEMDFISHPHTSAGRIPTDRGYRFYVDSLMEPDELNESEVKAVQDTMSGLSPDNILRDASRVLGLLSRYLGVVEIPELTDLIVHKIEIMPISSNRFLIVLALDSNMVKTVTLESRFEIDVKNIGEIIRFINDRVSGKPLRYIRENFKEIISDFDKKDMPLVRLFIDSVDKIFKSQDIRERIHIAGTQNLLDYPEFDDLSRVKGVIELFDNEDVIIHLLDKYEETADGGLKVLIGSELQNDRLDDYSMIVTKYKIGATSGSIGLIGPKRMKYSKMISLLQYVSEMITKNL